MAVAGAPSAVGWWAVRLAHGGGLDFIQRHQKPWEGAGSRGSPGSLSLQGEGTGTGEPWGAFWWGRPGLGMEERRCQKIRGASDLLESGKKKKRLPKLCETEKPLFEFACTCDNTQASRPGHEVPVDRRCVGGCAQGPQGQLWGWGLWPLHGLGGGRLGSPLELRALEAERVSGGG